MRKWMSTLLLILSFSAVSQTQPELSFSATQEADVSISTQMEVAREALRSKEYDKAIMILNNVLLLPTNRFTQEAQARIGFAYERSGKPTKAIAEYNAYIAMYPNSQILDSMRRRLLTLEVSNPQHETTGQTDKPRIANETKLDGSVSTYLVTSKSDTTLITNVTANGNFKRDEYTTKITIKENAKNDSDNSKTKYTLNRASIEVIDTFRKVGIKLGRQNPTDGVLGKYDGVELSMGKEPEYKLFLGKPSISTSDTKRMFFGGSRVQFVEPYVYTIYYNQQIADGFVERSAIGGDVRYFKDGLSASLITEYDIAYRQLNWVTTQVRDDTQFGSVFILYDRRKSPVLYGEKALELGLLLDNQLPYNSVKEALVRSGISREELYDYIVSETSTATNFAVGGSTTRGDWIMSGDYQLASMTGTRSQLGSDKSSSVSFMVMNPKLIKGHSVVALIAVQSKDNNQYRLTLLDSTSFGPIKLDSTLMLSSTDSKSLTLASHYAIVSDGMLEVMLVLNKVRESIDRTLIVGFKYEF